MRDIEGTAAPTLGVRDGVRWEVFDVEGAVRSLNPTTGAATPSELNRTRVLRFRADRSPRAKQSASVIEMPGFLGGAGWTRQRRQTIRRSPPNAVREADVSYQSACGLPAHVGDVHRVIAEIPAERRASSVFLLGHSLGASFAEAYARGASTTLRTARTSSRRSSSSAVR